MSEICKPCYGLSCPHWPQCMPQIKNDVLELRAENKRLQETADLALDTQARYHKKLSGALHKIKRLREALEGMCQQFAFWTCGIGGYHTGGLSALEDAFDVLDWTDPQPAPEACCQAPECKKQATCGTPTKDGYKWLCSEHCQALKEAEECG